MNNQVGAIILAGGQASRMGGEKPLRVLRGRTLLQHALDTVAPLATEIVVATGTRSLPLPPGVRAAPDQFKDAGPLAGIHAGLLALQAPRALLLPCDLPGIPTTLLAVLLKSLARAAVAYCELEAPEPLVCALRVRPALRAVTAAANAGAFKVVPVWQSLRHAVLHAPELAKLGDVARMFRNLNTLHDLDQA
jgi:molybdopterin-guanine dinucleotide biosynthesis protein A